jgi:uncharacterized protein (TIGR03437 family)
MPTAPRLGTLGLVTLVSLLLSTAASAQVAPVVAGSVPVGVRPAGIDIVPHFVEATFNGAGYPNNVFALVANSGENSLSVLVIAPPNAENAIIVTQTSKIEGVPSPYAVAACPATDSAGDYIVLVSSPSDNSVRAVEVRTQGSGAFTKVLGPLEVGSQPEAIACYQDRQGNLSGVASNLGDNSLSVFAVPSLTLAETISHVPASRGYHGIGVFANGSGNIAWVAGTDANVATSVNLDTGSVLTQTPIPNPTIVANLGGNTPPAIVGNNTEITFSQSGMVQIDTPTGLANPLDASTSPAGFGGFATVSGPGSLMQLPGIPNAFTVPGAAIATGPFELIPPMVNGLHPVPQYPLGSVLVTSPASNSVLVIERPPGLPSDFQVANAASFTGAAIAPGSLVSAFVTQGTGGSQIYKATPGQPIPTNLGGVGVSLAGGLNFTAFPGWTYDATGSLQAPLLFVGANQVNFQVPLGIAPGSAVPVQVTRSDGSTLLTTLNITGSAPGIFTVLQNGKGQGAILNQDYSQNGDPQSILGASPAPRGSVIQIYATGAGDTTPSLMPGEPAPANGNPLIQTNVQPTVTIGGVQAQVTFSGLAPGFVGLWQINAQIPQAVQPGNAVPLVISAGGITSNTVTIAVN